MPKTTSTIVPFIKPSSYCVALLLFLISLNKTFSQEVDSTKNKLCYIKAAYTGSIIYPGAKIGVERTISLTQFTRREKTIYKSKLISANVNWYHHRNFHHNIYFTAEWIMRKTHQNGVFTEFSPGIGYSRTFLDAVTYTFDNSNTISSQKSKGYNYALLSISGGLGYNLLKTQKQPISIYSRTSLLLLFPYNGFIYVRPFVEVGVSYKINKKTNGI